ncbi:hypothetical protein ABW19_dt0201538 [Dactylella cylindrospora]|nr:hypothetical protein ABW19_dt0201538 [Dactylella cylindrospora]
MGDKTRQNNTKELVDRRHRERQEGYAVHQISESPLELTLDQEELTRDHRILKTIERTKSKLRDLELQLDGHTPGFNLDPYTHNSRESHISDPLSRWYTEAATDGFFYGISEGRMPSGDLFNDELVQYEDEKEEVASTLSDACATCGLLSDISRGLSRL